uniref:Uncharacterized protein n=1 Tax=Anguilla anguilla TaxID=7936 RepID=A0A0E9W8U6_ANGAN
MFLQHTTLKSTLFFCSINGKIICNYVKPIGPNICSAFLNIWTKLNKILAVSKILLSNTNVGKRLNFLFQFKINSSCSQNSTCCLIRCHCLYVHNMRLRYGLPI